MKSQRLFEGALKALTADIDQAEKLLEELGVPVARIDEVREKLQKHQEAMADLEKERRQQFFEDAYGFATEIKTGNKVMELSRFLRRFAEHVAVHVLHGLVDEPDVDFEAIVDEVPTMAECEDNGEEENTGEPQ